MDMKVLAAAALAVVGGVAQAGVLTGFDGSTNEGWAGLTAFISNNSVSVSQSVPAVFSAVDGNPGGRISVADADSLDTMFAAPAAFLGNQSSAYGTSLGYDIFTNFSADYIGPNIVLQGNGLTLVHVPSVQVAELDAWRSVSVLLSPGANWHIDGFAGATPTEAQFQSVLGALSALWISGETHNGIEETSSLDNVRLGRVGQVPEPATLLLVAAAAAALSLRRRA